MYSRVQVGKHLSDMFPTENSLKKKRCLSTLIFNFALEYTIIRVQINQDSLKLNGTYQGLVYDEEFWVEAYIHYECETWSLILGEERRLKVFEIRVLW